jgi:hypothetical protein
MQLSHSTELQPYISSIKRKNTGKNNLGVIGSFIYALIVEKGSSNGPSTKVGFSFPSYSNLLNIS